MYFRILPFNIETQPVGVIVFSLVFLCLNLKKNMIINKQSFWLILYLIIIFFYSLLAFLYINNKELIITYFIRLTISPILFLIFLRNVKYLKPITIIIMVSILFVCASVSYFRIPGLFSFLNSIYDYFMQRYTFGEGTRGICILTPEPSYFVYFAILLFFSIDFLSYRSLITRRNNIILKLLLLLMCFFTKSAIVYLFMIIYLTLKIIKMLFSGIRKEFFIGLTLAIGVPIIGILIAFVGNNRFLEIFSNYDSSMPLIDNLFYSDSSSGFRLLINTVYILSLFTRPLGYGIAGMTDKWDIVAEAMNIDLSRNGMFIYTLSNESLLDAQAFMPNVIGTIGIFAITIFIFIYFNNTLKSKSLKYSIIIVLSLFFWIIQSNFFNPIFWVLIAFCKYNESDVEFEFTRGEDLCLTYQY